MDRQATIVMGKVVGVHGIKGNLKVQSYAEAMDFFHRGQELILKESDGSRRPVTIKRVQDHGRGLLMSVAGVTTRNQATTLVGAELLVERQRLPELADGTYYWADLIGLTVYEKGSRCLGVVVEILTTGGNDVYVVRQPHDPGGRELLIPALETVVTQIDLQRRIMKVDLPAGL